MSCAAVADVSFNEGANETPWPLAGKIAFRFSFLYLVLYMFFNGNVTVFTPLELWPGISNWIGRMLFLPFGPLTQWWTVKVFHVTGMAALWHRDGSGDTLLNYTLCLTFAGIALVGMAIWSALDWRRPHYRTLYAWLRFLVRINVGLGMLQYGFYKVFPVQMQPPSMTVLNEPLGNTSPMTLLWTLLGLVPMYERVCGLAEVAGGVLILFRRTALAGAMLSAFVMTNVVLYNVFFDVPVKLYALHLLAMACFVMLPDMRPLWDFFVARRHAQQAGVWVPPTKGVLGRRAVIAVEVVFLVGTSIVMMKYDGDRYKAYLESVRPAPVIGLWRLEAGQPEPVMLGGLRWQSISIDSLSRGMARSADGQLWRMYLTYNEGKHTLGMISRGGLGAVTYAWQSPDTDHLVLTSAGKTMVFERVATPKQYPLMTRGFHMVSEFGYER